MLKVGLTGGIATGKSYVLSVLRERGAAVMDADTVAHEVIEPGQPAYREILDHFGPEVPDLVAADGRIDRAKLGAVVFADRGKLEQLNSIVHPRVFEAQNRWFAELERQDPRAIAIFDAALMIETGSYRRFDTVIVVYCDPDLQLERLMNRNRLTREEAMKRISAQMPTAEKLKYADFAIDTSNGFEETRRQVEELYGRLRRAEEAGGNASERAAAAEGGEAEPQPQ